MKKLSLLLVSVILVAIAVICINFNSIEATALNKSLEKTVGDFVSIYEYVYEDNTPDLIENHYIKIQSRKGKLTGWYYGTSDDFDEGREGYRPGFFVKEMEDLVITKSGISFILNVKLADFVTKPISVKYNNRDELPAKEYKKWDIGKMDIRPRRYKGIYRGNKIILKIDNEKRIFNKK
jgi:hypothetical protein